MDAGADVELGRAVVKRGLATEAQLIDALHARRGRDLGAVLLERRLVSAAQLEELRRAVARGDGAVARDRDEVATDHEISIGGTREILARDQLEEALRSKDARAAYRELRRLAQEFPDTESGVRAAREAEALAKKYPGVAR